MTDRTPLPASSMPFFLPTAHGQRLCVWHAPPSGEAVQEALLYVHPFGDEMHKSRRMAALQSRALAAGGTAVLQIDLYGCGDSSGDFADARWEIWRGDLAVAHAWLASRLDVPIGLWGLRLGALLALDYAKHAVPAISRLILWQPIISGEAYMTQFLRLKLASEMLGGGTPATDHSGAGSAGGGTRGLRDAMRNGESLEVAGYELAPELAGAIDAVTAVALAPLGQTVEWFEVVGTTDRPMPPASRRLADDWQRAGVAIQTWCVAGPSFWSNQEIVECPSLLTCTTQVVCRLPA